MLSQETGYCGVVLPRTSDAPILELDNLKLAVGKRNPNEQTSVRRVLMQVLPRKRGGAPIPGTRQHG
jgi:hypothetical protein